MKNPSLTAVTSALIGNSLIGVLKLIGWYFSKSPSMLAEALHSFADVFNQALLFVGIKASSSQSTSEYNWGTTQAQYVFNLASGIGIFFIGCVVSLYHGFSELLYPHSEVKGFGETLSLIILVIAFIVESYTLYIAYKGIMFNKKELSFKDYILKGDDPTVVSVFLEDFVALIGVVLAFIGIGLSKIYATSIPDAISAIIIGFLLAGVSAFLIIQNSKFLLGRSVSPEKELLIKEFIEALPIVEKVFKIKTEVLGPARVYLSLEVEFHGTFFVDRNQLTRDAERIKNGEAIVPVLMDVSERMVRQIGREINEIERKIKAEFPEVSSIDLEIN